MPWNHSRQYRYIQTCNADLHGTKVEYSTHSKGLGKDQRCGTQDTAVTVFSWGSFSLKIAMFITQHWKQWTEEFDSKGFYNVLLTIIAVIYWCKGTYSSLCVLGIPCQSHSYPWVPLARTGIVFALFRHHQREAVTPKSVSAHLSYLWCHLEVLTSAH